MATSYKQAGVDIDKGNAFVDAIKPATKRTNRPGVMGAIGGFGGLFDLAAAGYDNPLLVAATDGVGTKLRLGLSTGRISGLGVDLVAMCVNDLIVQGAEPLFFLDYYATGALDLAAATAVVDGIADGCAQARCALIGGETAEMPGLYDGHDFDLAGFAVGAVDRDKVLPRPTLNVGDTILGLASSGPHSNGYSLINKILGDANIDTGSVAPFDAATSLAEGLMTPTKIYVSGCRAAIATGSVTALAHITGGGLAENLARVLPADRRAIIAADSWPVPPVFGWLARTGDVPDVEMMRVFNCGIGMVLIVDADTATDAKAALIDAGETVFDLGHVEARSPSQPAVELAPLTFNRAAQ